MQYSKLIEMTDEALVHRELQLERELLDARFRHKTGQLDDFTTLGKIRKEIARSRTAQRGRERDQSLNPNTLRDQHRTSFKPAAVGTGEGASGGFLKGIVDKVTPNE
jgi:ribosomal protein L29